MKIKYKVNDELKKQIEWLKKDANKSTINIAVYYSEDCESWIGQFSIENKFFNIPLIDIDYEEGEEGNVIQIPVNNLPSNGIIEKHGDLEYFAHDLKKGITAKNKTLSIIQEGVDWLGKNNDNKYSLFPSTYYRHYKNEITLSRYHGTYMLYYSCNTEEEQYYSGWIPSKLSNDISSFIFGSQYIYIKEDELGYVAFPQSSMSCMFNLSPNNKKHTIAIIDTEKIIPTKTEKDDLMLKIENKSFNVNKEAICKIIKKISSKQVEISFVNGYLYFSEHSYFSSNSNIGGLVRVF